jgi:hypothetical protein
MISARVPNKMMMGMSWVSTYEPPPPSAAKATPGVTSAAAARSARSGQEAVAADMTSPRMC